MARRKTSETAGPAADAYAATLDEEAGALDDEVGTAPDGDVAEPGGPTDATVPRVRGAVKRDARGRFSRPGSRIRKGGRPTAGRRGPSYLARRRQEALVRMCIVMEHKVGRLEAEWIHEEWRDPVAIRLARMKGIDALQADGQARRLAALTEVLVDMNEDRIPRDMPKRHEEIAKRVSVKLGEHFAWRTLYNKPYRSAWRTVDDALAKHPADDAATFPDRSRWKKPMLVHEILKMGRRRDELLPMLRARLLEETADEEGWDPIPRRLGTA